MKVLQVIDSLSPAGAEIIVQKLSELLPARGIQSEIYALRRTGSWLETACCQKRIPVHYSPAGSLYSPLQPAALNRHVLANRYDLVHVHLFPAQLWTALAARLGHWTFPSLTTEHGVTNRRRTPLTRNLDAWMYRQYAALVAVSDGASAALMRWIRSGDREVRTIHNGIDLSAIDAAPPATLKQDLGLAGADLLAISVGRCEIVKNYECSIRALAAAGARIHLAIAGDGAHAPSLRRLAASLGVAGRVHFLGKRSDVFSLLKGADFYVQSSLGEGFGVAAVEAMAAGLPMVTAAVPGLGEVVGPAGLTFHPRDHAALASCLSELAANPARRAALAVASRLRARQFPLSKTADQYAALYRSLVGRVN